MLDSTMATAAFLLLATVAVFFVNPIIAIVPLLLLVALFALKAGGSLFKHAGASVNGGASGGPSVPSTREASYEPVAKPGE